MDLFEKATNPHFYDSCEIEWEGGAVQSPARQLIVDCLRSVFDAQGKSVIDVGSGTGAFFSFYKEMGAESIEGIEPSQKSFNFSKKDYPDISVFNGTFDDYNPRKKFDRVVSVMVFEHISDIKKAFKKIFDLLVDGGIFYLVIANMDYALTPRHNYTLQIQDLQGGEHVVANTRSYGTLYDIVRPVKNFQLAAEEAGLELVKNLPVTPNEKLIAAAPKYKDFKHMAVFNLLVFKKG